MSTITLTRKQLFNLVWSEPFLSLSKKYNISDVGLRKMCKRLKIPFPKTGYWQNVHAGRDMEIPELEFDSSLNNEISLELRTEPSPSVLEEASALLKLQQEIENDPKVKLRIPQNLHAPDQLVVIARGSLLESNPWSGPNTIRSTDGNQFSISVSKPQIRRALSNFYSSYEPYNYFQQRHRRY